MSSSNAVVANSSDNWSSDGDIVNAVTTRSWIVLQQAGIASNFQICLDMNNTNAMYGSMIVSPSAGFTGGSTTARPTATDENVYISSAPWINASLTDIALRWTVMQSDDGECTRIVVCGGGSVQMLAIIDKPANAVTGWTNPSVWSWFASTPTIYSQYFTTYNFRGRVGSTLGSFVALQEGWNNSLASQDATWGNIANEVSSEWPMLPLGMACNTAGVRGRHGSFYDLWAGSASVATGDTYPGDGSNQFAQFGCIILPWNGGAVNLS